MAGIRAKGHIRSATAESQQLPNKSDISSNVPLPPAGISLFIDLKQPRAGTAAAWGIGHFISMVNT